NLTITEKAAVASVRPAAEPRLLMSGVQSGTQFAATITFAARLTKNSEVPVGTVGGGVGAVQELPRGQARLVYGTLKTCQDPVSSGKGTSGPWYGFVMLLSSTNTFELTVTPV